MTLSECLFCRIAHKELSAKVVFEDDTLIAIEDINPATPVHILIMPKAHIASLNDVGDDNELLLGHIQTVAACLARELNLAEAGLSSGQQLW